jgi:hypothetical protein
MVEYCNNMIALEQCLAFGSLSSKHQKHIKTENHKRKVSYKSTSKHRPTSTGNKQTKTKVKTAYKTALSTNNIIQ